MYSSNELEAKNINYNQVGKTGYGLGKRDRADFGVAGIIRNKLTPAPESQVGFPI